MLTQEDKERLEALQEQFEDAGEHERAMLHRQIDAMLKKSGLSEKERAVLAKPGGDESSDDFFENMPV